MQYIGAIDQGTTSTRFIIFNSRGEIVSSDQIEHRQIYPQPGWVEHDPQEIWRNTQAVIHGALDKAGLEAGALSAIGITNQRETTLAFNPETGKIYHNAIVWQDLRTTPVIARLKERLGQDELASRTGLRFSPYFSAGKIIWLIENVPAVREAVSRGEVVFGTMDCYLVWRLTGQVVTDVTNASRYMLMDIRSMDWDDDLLGLCGITRDCLPRIVPSIGEVYGHAEIDGARIPVCGMLGDQQAALFGQACFGAGMAKCTYGTGCFMLVNTGSRLCLSRNGLLSTVAYQKKGEDPVYAIEGSVAIAGSLVQWTRDSLKMVRDVHELDELAASVEDSGGVYIVPAFSGLFAPHWRSDARGVIAGLTGYANRAHICRAVLEATAFQANDIFEAMKEDSGISLSVLKVDGGLTNSAPLMAFQADILGIPVIRPKIVETTALGAAYAAGLGTGIWQNEENLAQYWKEQLRWTPGMDESVRRQKISFWRKAVSRTLDWAEKED